MKEIKMLLCVAFMIFAFGSMSYAKTFVNDGVNTKCLDDNGRYAVSAFRWYDDNNDGISELYYFDENGMALKNEDMIINDYCTDSNGKLYNPELASKFIQMPNEYVNDAYCMMMNNPQDASECNKVYQSVYDSIEKYVNYYVNIKTLAIRDSGVGQVSQTLSDEAEAEIPVYTYGLIASDVGTFYKNNEAYDAWRTKIDNLRKSSLDKIRKTVRNNK